jgi:hypothetical protein
MVTAHKLDVQVLELRKFRFLLQSPAEFVYYDADINSDTQTNYHPEFLLETTDDPFFF